MKNNENQVRIREYESKDLESLKTIWNEVVEDGIAFPQEDLLDLTSAKTFFGSQSYCGVAEKNGKVVGLYILHPNNVGRCGHIANASFAVSKKLRGQHIGKALVSDAVGKTKELGFRILQFNAVVASNTNARKLYESLGFTPLGKIPGGFRMKDGHYEDIYPYYIETI